jgi:NADH dehydrogenase [ubiquinone] 1 alpha subcomplex assembly factor 7
VTPLGGKIAALIAANGPITVADYMALCLGDPEHGYYMAREPFGGGGDFVTAPEVSQVFGELIGLWAVATWQAMGSPSPFVLAELGPGRGTLMADLLRAARVRPAFLDAARIHLVETSPRLRAEQEAALSGVAVTWHTDIHALPPGPLIVVANEFFDALPIRQYARTATGWAERMVGLDDAGRLAFGLRDITQPVGSGPGLGELPSPPLVPAQAGTQFLQGAALQNLGPRLRGDERVGAGYPPAKSRGHDQDQSMLEVSPAATAIMSSLAARIAAEGGAALVIDYGYEGPAFGDTLQAVRGHAYADPLAEPGAADLTAHVDFTALVRAAAEAGAPPRLLVTQGDFLGRLGIAARAERLAAGKDDATRGAIAAALHRLTAPDAMGDLFKVLALSHSGLALPAFDGDA